MTQPRKSRSGARPASIDPNGSAEPTGASRPFTARSVVASTLLGVDPPRLPTRLLVRSGELFGISQGTTRVALSRMVAAGELVVDGDAHRLAGHLLERQARQQVSRAPAQGTWDGGWALAVVTESRRPVSTRAELRRAMGALRLAELREGVWLRPDNLDERWAGPARAVVDAQCRRFTARPDDRPDALAARLWDLDGWADQARQLQGRLGRVVTRLEAGETTALGPGFVLSADALRHLQADPLLPSVLLPSGWPGDALRVDYDRYDRAFKQLWRDWFRREADH